MVFEMTYHLGGGPKTKQEWEKSEDEKEKNVF